MKPRLYYLGQPEDGFGWGVANTNLIAALGEFCEVVTVPRNKTSFDAPAFAPIARYDLAPCHPWKAPRLIGYCFAELPIPESARVNSRCYDVLFAGSEWGANRLREAGCKRVDTLLQGIDFKRFQPMSESERKGFVVFSGGKYEFRKGQDYVIAAMRRFMEVRKDAVLLASWHNIWPESVRTMELSWLIDPAKPNEGLPAERVMTVPPVKNHQIAKVYEQAHIGLFPNRCEAGTNLVMSEFMACGRPVIASYAHGHKDVLNPDYPYLLKNGDYDPAGWFNPSVSDILAHLEHAYQHREQLGDRARECRKMVEKLSWRDCAEKIFKAAYP
jgi:glycosyltransferase involved in cell wall biosynthesis